MPKRRPVKNLDTKQMFPSLIDAARSVGGIASNIQKGIERSGTAYGYRWDYADDIAPMVLCIETGETFATLVEAGNAYYLAPSTISRAISYNRPAGNKTWRWLDCSQEVAQ